MFGPNTLSSFSYNMNYSHRCDTFKSLYKRLVSLMQQKFNLHDYDIIFIPGSGTFGAETLIRSSKNKINLIGNDGKFKDRWKNLSDSIKFEENKEQNMFCQLETSNSSIYSKNSCFVDAISSFPFYQIPDDTKAFVCCSNKQIGAHPGLSIVFIRKDCWGLFKEEELFSITNLSLYKKYYLENQLPTTAPVQIFEQLLNTMESFDVEVLRKKIILNSNKVTSLFEDSQIIGEKICPVITIKKDSIPTHIANKFKIYHYNNSYPFYQIFTYSTENSVYDDFVKEVKNGNN